MVSYVLRMRFTMFKPLSPLNYLASFLMLCLVILCSSLCSSSLVSSSWQRGSPAVHRPHGSCCLRMRGLMKTKKLVVEVPVIKGVYQSKRRVCLPFSSLSFRFVVVLLFGEVFCPFGPSVLFFFIVASGSSSELCSLEVSTYLTATRG